MTTKQQHTPEPWWHPTPDRHYSSASRIAYFAGYSDGFHDYRRGVGYEGDQPPSALFRRLQCGVAPPSPSSAWFDYYAAGIFYDAFGRPFRAARKLSDRRPA